MPVQSTINSNILLPHPPQNTQPDSQHVPLFSTGEDDKKSALHPRTHSFLFFVLLTDSMGLGNPRGHRVAGI